MGGWAGCALHKKAQLRGNGNQSPAEPGFVPQRKGHLCLSGSKAPSDPAEALTMPFPCSSHPVEDQERMVEGVSRKPQSAT